MTVQTVNLQPLSYSPFYEKVNESNSFLSDLSFIGSQSQSRKKQIDHFLSFSKLHSSQSVSSALELLGNSVSEVNEPIQKLCDASGRVVQFLSLDKTIDYKLDYHDATTIVTNQITGEVHIQETDQQGRLIREILPCGLEIAYTFDGDYLSEVTFPDQSKVEYRYIDSNHLEVQRYKKEGTLSYQHVYETVGEYITQETLIGHAGSLNKQYDPQANTITIQSESICCIHQFDEDQNLISKTFKDPVTHQDQTIFDFANQRLLNKEASYVDDIGRVIHFDGFTCSYDPLGRLVQKVSKEQTVHYKYDAFDRLIHVNLGDKAIDYTYDLFGRRFSKTISENGNTSKEFYLYQGVNQIGVYDENKELKHLRVLGAAYHMNLPLSIAIESQGNVYAPIYDTNYNVLQLINQKTQEVTHYESLSPFGDNLKEFKPITPWVFATKYYDEDTGLLDFGDRQYDPSIQQWTSKDSDPRVSQKNLYSYCNHNPLKYIDPDGRFAFVVFVPLAIGFKAALVALGIGVAAAGARVAIQKGAGKIENKELAKMLLGVGPPLINAAVDKVKEMPFPDRDLPRYPEGAPKEGEPMPDTDAPHTQLGHRNGRGGRYPQAREFGENGEPIRDIDFTDHGRPQNHPCPHQHTYDENQTGGTKKRNEEGEPVPEFDYEEN